MMPKAALLLQALAACSLVTATPASPPSGKRNFFSFSSSATIETPHGRFTGLLSRSWQTEYWYGVPYAQPPTGNLRYRPPEPVTGHLGDRDVSRLAPGCPQRGSIKSYTSGLQRVALRLLGITMLDDVPGQEDCLTLDIYRPTWKGRSSSSSSSSSSNSGGGMPVLVFFHGGSFDLGGARNYDAGWIQWQAAEPLLYVAVNYRLGGFGFLPGREVLRDGAANLGLLDQRRALEWIADNIGHWGGDPDKVTIWGQSAGAISVLDQLVMYDGRNTHSRSNSSKPLFRGAIMSSGSVIPADPVDCAKAQAVYDKVVEEAGCRGAPDTLDCLRGVDYDTLLRAVRSNPSADSNPSLALSYLPRPDGTVFRDSPHALLQQGRFARVPAIIGGVEDEGTMFASAPGGLRTTDDIAEYLARYYFHNLTAAELAEYVGTYPGAPASGSPFRSAWAPPANSADFPPAFKRVAAILGDLVFEMPRRETLERMSGGRDGQVAAAGAVEGEEAVPLWSYVSSVLHGSSLLPHWGTFHGTDVLLTFNRLAGYYSGQNFRTYFSNFVINQDPNSGHGGYTYWHRYRDNKEVMNMEWQGNVMKTWNPRQDSQNWIRRILDMGRLKF